MIVSLNWIKKYIDINLPIEKLVTLIGARLVEIESVTDLSAKYKDALVVKVVESSQLEGSDHLNVVKIDDGGTLANVERDQNGLVQVVCGAPNISAGQLVVWLPPESIVPNTYGQPEPFVLGKRELRGVMSNGMIASARELDLFDEHEGILVLDKDILPGKSFAESYELNDHLLDIENKSLTHRPDCFSVVGFAREVAAISGKTFRTPEWLMNISPDFNYNQPDGVSLDVTIDDAELSARYQAIVMSVADGSGQSPLQVQTYLSRLGVRPINAVVDVTNYLMMLTGQPLHAFDYDKLVSVAGGKADIHVRSAKDNESLELLDGRTIELSEDDIVIAAGDTAIGLAGAMGGANTAIDNNTKNIVIESATFNLYKLRATQMRHGIFSEAITRFTKGQPASLTASVLSNAIVLMGDWAGARQISALAETYPNVQESSVLEFTAESINNILGSAYNDNDIASKLRGVEFEVDQLDQGSLRVTAPYWRADIYIVEDVAEEIGRLNGFDNIVPTLATREFTAVKPDDFDIMRSRVRKVLARAGANEVLTYSFVHGDLMQKVGQDVKNSYRIINSISPNLQYYRQSLTPSLLDLIHPNIKQGYDSFAVFELNKTHSKQDGLTDEKVPIESDSIALVVSNKNKISGASYYQARRMLDYLCDSLGLKVSYVAIDQDADNLVAAPFECRRSAHLVEKTTGLAIGIVGEYKKSVVRGFKLPESSAGFELNTRAMFNAVQSLDSSYTPVSRYPSSERDICFSVDESISYSQIIAAAEGALESITLESILSSVDIYQSLGAKTKNITIRVKLTSYSHTLTGDEVSSAIDSLAELVVAETHASVI